MGAVAYEIRSTFHIGIVAAFPALGQRVGQNETAAHKGGCRGMDHLVYRRII